MRKICTLVLFFTLFVLSTLVEGSHFCYENEKPIVVDNVEFSFMTPFGEDKSKFLDAYLQGTSIFIRNNTNSLVVIKWAESSINYNSESCGVPFLQGMKFTNAGDPSATPNTMVGPRKNMLLNVYFPLVEFIKGPSSRWIVKGVRMQGSATNTISLYLSVVINNRQQYVCMESSKICY